MSQKLTLPLVVGKKYVTQEGRIARVVCIDRQGGADMCVLALHKSAGGGEDAYYHKSNGHGGYSGFDLVADYHEPVTRYMNLYRYPSGSLWFGGTNTTRKEADRQAQNVENDNTGERIACVKVTATPGQFDD